MAELAAKDSGVGIAKCRLVDHFAHYSRGLIDLLLAGRVHLVSAWVVNFSICVENRLALCWIVRWVVVHLLVAVKSLMKKLSSFTMLGLRY